jgi:hypothetical protein
VADEDAGAERYFEQYKLAVEMADRISARRIAASASSSRRALRF